MNINELTLGQIKEINSLVNSGATAPAKPCPVKIGNAYLFRTVTHIELGRVVEIIGDFVKLEEASWIADTGRYHNALRDGTLSEVEPYPDYTIVALNSMVNIAPWNHELPKEQK